MDTLTPAIDPQTGALSLGDGALAWAPSAAIGLVVWTLRTPLGACLADPALGVDWTSARTDTADAPQTLRREIERALRWLVDAGFLTELVVDCQRQPPRGLVYAITFRDGAETRTLRGTT